VTAAWNLTGYDGPTYRQLDHWVRRGYLNPGNANAGTGNYRQWPAGELRIANLMYRLIQAGLTPAAAARVARAGVGGAAELAPGIRIVIDERPPQGQ